MDRHSTSAITTNHQSDLLHVLYTTTVKNEFDELGRIVKQTFADGSNMYFQYDDNNERIILTQQNGNEHFYEYNINNKLEKYRNPLGFESVIKYNKHGFPLENIRFNGTRFCYLYDDKDNLIEEINQLGYHTVKQELYYVE